MKLILYTKLNCHLCSEAYQMLLDIAWDMPLEIDLIDITHAHNRDIQAAYFDRIPVLGRPGIAAELNWPFTPDDIKVYLAGG